MGKHMFGDVQLQSLGIAAVIVVVANVGRGWFKRRVREPGMAWTVLMTAAATVITANVVTATIAGPSPNDLTGDVVAISSWCILAAAIATVMAHLVPFAPARTPRRVLAVGAHPDDVELACGATIAKFADAGHEVHVLVMSAGRRGGTAHTRRLEAGAGARFMGAVDCQVLDMPDTELAEHGNEMVTAIEKAVHRINPDLILTHSSHDQHQDHQAVHNAALRACRGHSSILCFESPSATRDFNPSVFVDVADHLDTKVHAVGLHQDQAAKAYMKPARLRATAGFRGAQARREFAEGFEPVRWLDSTIEGS